MIKLIFRQFKISISHITGECAIDVAGWLCNPACVAVYSMYIGHSSKQMSRERVKTWEQGLGSLAKTK